MRQKFYRLGRHQVWGDTKNHKDNFVAIPPVLVDELRRLQDHQFQERRVFANAYEDHGLVFCQSNGKPLHAHNISQRDFKNVAKLAKVRCIRLYDLRHCHATFFADVGAPVHVLQDRMGHGSPQVALRYYIHHRSESQREPANKLAARLLGDISEAGGSRE